MGCYVLFDFNPFKFSVTPFIAYHDLSYRIFYALLSIICVLLMLSDI